MKAKFYITLIALFIGLAAFATNDLRLGQNYPNPAKGKTYIQVDFETTTASLKVYNVLGKMLMQKTLNETGLVTLDVSHYPEGVYIYMLEADGVKITKRMTVKK